MTTQTPATLPMAGTPGGPELDDPAEAARYALLQRLAPALQHHLMGKFQSVGMIASMMERRFQLGQPDLGSLREDCQSLSSVSRNTVEAIVNLMTWIEPNQGATVALDTGVRECVGLLATKLRFKGFTLVNEVDELAVPVRTQALRSVLSATLLALTDMLKVPATLVLRAVHTAGAVHLSVQVLPAEGGRKNSYANDYRALRQRDVETLALAESVQLTLDASGARLVVPCAAAQECQGLQAG